MFRRPHRLIVPQYQAPKGLSLIAAAELLGDGKRAVAAQLIDFAVRRVVTIARSAGKRKGSGFTLTLVGDASVEGADERGILIELFGSTLRRGASLTISPGRNRELGQRLRTPHRDAVARLIAGGLAAEQPLFLRVLTFWRKQPVVPTAQAYPLVDHLWGIHDYVRLAEKERFAFLQSPEGALRREPLNEVEVLVLNEKLLPYAVLFNLEKQWMAELDLQYRSLPPEFADSVDGMLLVAELVVNGVQIIEAVADLAVLVDAADALDGVGAIFGGIGEALSALGDLG